jgi:alcohol dehydrogenase class IV
MVTSDGIATEFVFEYDPGELRCGRGRASDLADLLAARGHDDALVVTGRSVGETAAVMDPVEAGLGDRLAGVFAETTPDKTLGTALAAARRVRAGRIDAMVAVGGGSSLDVAKAASALTSHDDPSAAAERALSTGEVGVGTDHDPVPVVAVPTTLAGADLSVIAGTRLTLDRGPGADGAPSGSIADRRLMPTALVYDLALFETTPRSVLCASAMNGFDKAVECLYSPSATPVTDGTASRALALMRSGFETLPAAPGAMDERKLYEAVSGVILAQYGISTPGTYRASIVHAFGHGVSRGTDVHQGVAHGVCAPHVLRYVFDEVDGRRALLADALGVETGAATGSGSGSESGADADADADALAEGVVDAVADVRDDLGLPTRLRDLEGIDRESLPAIAAAVHDDGLMSVAPVGLEPSVDDLRAVLETAW